MKNFKFICMVGMALILASCDVLVQRPYNTDTNITGTWKSVNTTTYVSDPNVFNPNGVTESFFNIQDNNGTLTITSYSDNTGFPITWISGTGTYYGNSVSISMSGYYYNTYNQRVTVTLTMSGSINGTSGSGTFTEVFSVNGGSVTCQGNTVYTKM